MGLKCKHCGSNNTKLMSAQELNTTEYSAKLSPEDLSLILKILYEMIKMYNRHKDKDKKHTYCKSCNRLS